MGVLAVLDEPARMGGVPVTIGSEMLDRFVPPRGQCGICGVPGIDARHRIIDTVEEHAQAGELGDEIAAELGLQPETVIVILHWCRENPDKAARGPWLP